MQKRYFLHDNTFSAWQKENFPKMMTSAAEGTSGKLSQERKDLDKKQRDLLLIYWLASNVNHMHMQTCRQQFEFVDRTYHFLW